MVTETANYVVESAADTPTIKRPRTVQGDFVISGLYLEQSYYWTDEWQKGEKEADSDIKQGRVTHFKNADDAIRHLRSRKNKGK